MAETAAAAAGIHFGPAWLRDTFVQPPAQGGGEHPKAALNVMAPAKLAEFRYGREEMLALFNLPQHASLPSHQEKVVSNAGLLADRPQLPLNLMGPMSEDEQRAWQRGANSDTSLRLYKKDSGPAIAGGPGMGRGGGGERGRGRGRGFFERHRNDDDDGGPREQGSRPFARGGSRTFDRSLSDRGSWFDRPAGQMSGEEGPANGSVSPRKNYRAPFDDWRKPAAAPVPGSSAAGTGGNAEDEESGWRTGGSASGRRWNAPPGADGGRGGGSGGWRTVSSDNRDREYHNGSSRWHTDDTYSRRGGFSGRGGFNRSRSRQDSDLPEWASEDMSDASKASGGFDSSGKFSSSIGKQPPKRVISLNRDLRDGEEEADRPVESNEAFEDEEVDVDDLPQGLRREAMKEPAVAEQPKVICNEEPEEDDAPQQIEAIADDFVSKLIEDDEPESPEPEQPPQPTPPKPGPDRQQIPSVQQIQWFYLDPQGNEQGPFCSSDMLEWFEAGCYFPADLMLRRSGIDRRFTPLNEMSRLYGRVPFMPGPAPGPIGVEENSAPTPPPPQMQPPPPPQQSTASPPLNSNHQAALMQQMQQHVLLQQQLLRQQQQLFAIQQSPLSEVEKAQLINKIMQLSILPPTSSPQPPTMLPPKPSTSASDISMLLKQHDQPSPFGGGGAFNMPKMDMHPMMTSSAESGLQLLGNLKGPATVSEPPPFNPIESLLNQLQQQQQHQNQHEQLLQERSVSLESNSTNNQQMYGGSQHENACSPSPPPLQRQSPNVPRSIWDNQKVSPEQPRHETGVWGDGNRREPQNSFYNHVQQQRELGSQQQYFDNEEQQLTEDDNNGFVKPKANDKKDKKSKRAEEKKRAREREAKKAQAAASEYIPGMEGSVRPSHDQSAAVQHVFEEDDTPLLIEQQVQTQQPTFQPKLAPWAKVSEGSPINSGETNLTLAEIQKIEEEREREAKMRRELHEAALAQARQDEEARRQQAIGLNWAHTAKHNDGAQKSLAEIQAEEQRQERERLEREKREKKARQKEMGLSQASVWGSASTNLSWASKTAAPSATSGFWDSEAPQQREATPQAQQQKKKKNQNKAKEESKVAAIFKESKGKPSNEFEEWCISALEKLNPQVDIPTFLNFLKDVDSPYEVNDYVKNYIGDGKGPKNFAKEYVERRSRWKNSIKAARKVEDDLLMPAVAINPNEPDEVVPVLGGGGNHAAKKNKKKSKSKSKLDASHLLGFSVAAADRPNAGELDLPQ